MGCLGHALVARRVRPAQVGVGSPMVHRSNNQRYKAERTPREGRMRQWLVVVMAVMMLAATGVEAGEIPPVLRMSAIPDENPTELSRIYTPFAEYLQRTTGMPVQFTPVVDYAATVEGMVAGKLDLVWFGGLTHVQARLRTNNTAYAIAMREEDLQFKRVFITNPQAHVTSLEELRGKTFAFGSAGSTS